VNINQPVFSILVALAALQLSATAFADDHRGTCSVGLLAGKWAFATDVGHETLSFGGDITALGTFAVERDGSANGVFDVTFDNVTFVANVPFDGTITVGADCRGTLTFVTGTGARRTDSIIVLNRYEIWGMSQDPQNLWTYRARRLPGR
jgi:hypothetical protein